MNTPLLTCRRIFTLAFVLTLGFGGSLTAQRVYTVADVPTVEQLNGFVFDPERVLGAEAAEIAARLEALDLQTDAQGAVVMLPSIGEAVPKDFAVELFARLRLGNAGTDFGYLLLVVADQRRAEIETGYGLERYLTDLLAKRLLGREFVPRMRAGRPGEAVSALTRSIDEVVRAGLAGEDVVGEAIAAPRERDFGGLLLALWVYLGVAALVYLVLAALYYEIYREPVSLYDKWRRVNNVHYLALAILFPLPGIFVRLAAARWMRRLRVAPRYHPDTGEALALLSDYDEIDVLENGALVEQELDVAEWDVWTNPAGDHVLALRYGAAAERAYRKCPECGYRTYKRASSRVLRAPTYDRGGRREVTYACKACAYEAVKTEAIPRKVRSSSSSSSSSSSGGGYSGGGGSSFSGGGGSSGGGGAGASW